MLEVWVNWKRGKISVVPAQNLDKERSTYDIQPDDPRHVTIAVIQVEKALENQPKLMSAIRHCYFNGGARRHDWRLREKLVERIRWQLETGPPGFIPETIAEYGARMGRRRTTDIKKKKI